MNHSSWAFPPPLSFFSSCSLIFKVEAVDFRRFFDFSYTAEDLAEVFHTKISCKTCIAATAVGFFYTKAL